VRYVVWVEQPDGQTGGGAENEFDSLLSENDMVEHGGRSCVVTDVDESQFPPHVWLRPVK
jgi:hypothetical protein